MTLELTLSAVVPLLVGLLNLLVAAYAVASALAGRSKTPPRTAVAFAAAPAGVGAWSLAWFVSVFDPEGLEVARALAGAGLFLGVAGVLADALEQSAPRRRPWVLAAAAVAAALVSLAVAVTLGLPKPHLRAGLVTRVLTLSGLGGVAVAAWFEVRGPEGRAARRRLGALAACAVAYAALAGVAYARDKVGVDVLLFVVLALELLTLDTIVARRVEVEVLVARALTYAFLAVVVAGLAAWLFSRLGYEVDLVTVSVTVAVSLVASALFMGLADPITRRVERAIFPEHARLEVALEASRTELSALRRRLERAERLALAGELAASVAHEIKNPLSPVRGYAQMLAGRLDQVDPEARPLFDKGLGIIRSEVDRIDARVRELLDLSRAQSPALDPEARFALAPVLRDAALVAGAEPGIERVSLGPLAPGLEVLGDADALRGALVNLIKNAGEAMEQAGHPGQVELRMEADGEAVRVRVLDEGPGLVATDPERAFEAFYTTKEGGTGLGLAIAKSAVQACGGRLDLRSRKDRTGAVAEIELLRATKETE